MVGKDKKTSKELQDEKIMKLKLFEHPAFCKNSYDQSIGIFCGQALEFVNLNQEASSINRYGPAQQQKEQFIDQ